jgi:hypothetical protein
MPDPHSLFDTSHFYNVKQTIRRQDFGRHWNQYDSVLNGEDACVMSIPIMRSAVGETSVRGDIRETRGWRHAR